MQRERIKWGVLRRLNRHHFSVIRELARIPGSRPLLRRFWNPRIWDNYAFAPGRSGEELMFIHIPKCAGTSIARMLLGQTLPCVPGYPYLIADPARYARAFRFSVFRDPAQQILSMLYHLESSDWAQPADKRFFARERLVDESAESLLERFATDTGFQKRLFSDTWIGRSGMAIRPHEFVEFDGRLIVNALFSFDRLDLLVSELSERTRRSLTLAHDNRSRLGGEPVPLDRAIVALLRRHFPRDYALWDRLGDSGGVIRGR
ncbi:MAG: hypothetical protein AAF654_04370 [Myxococcota bacterium]